MAKKPVKSAPKRLRDRFGRFVAKATSEKSSKKSRPGSRSKFAQETNRELNSGPLTGAKVKKTRPSGTLARRIFEPKSGYGLSDTRYDYTARFIGKDAATRAYARLDQFVDAYPKLDVRARAGLKLPGFGPKKGTSNERGSTTGGTLNFINAKSSLYEGDFTSVYVTITTRGFSIDSQMEALGWKLGTPKLLTGTEWTSKAGKRGKKAKDSLEAVSGKTQAGNRKKSGAPSMTSKLTAASPSKGKKPQSQLDQLAVALFSPTGKNTSSTTPPTKKTKPSSKKSSNSSKKKRKTER